MSSSPLIHSFLIDLLSPGIQTRMERVTDTSAIILSPVSVSLMWRISLSRGTPDLATKKHTLCHSGVSEDTSQTESKKVCSNLC